MRSSRRNMIVIAAIVLVAAGVGVVFLGGSPSKQPFDLSEEVFFNLATNDRVLSRLHGGEYGEALIETYDASERNVWPLEIPTGLVVYVRGAIDGGVVRFLISPSWSEAHSVDYQGGPRPVELINNTSGRTGRVTIEARPTEGVTGQLTLFAN